LARETNLSKSTAFSSPRPIHIIASNSAIASEDSCEILFTKAAHSGRSLYKISEIIFFDSADPDLMILPLPFYASSLKPAKFIMSSKSIFVKCLTISYSSDERFNARLI
jgi:hypothetical protein